MEGNPTNLAQDAQPFEARAQQHLGKVTMQRLEIAELGARLTQHIEVDFEAAGRPGI